MKNPILRYYTRPPLLHPALARRRITAVPQFTRFWRTAVLQPTPFGVRRSSKLLTPFGLAGLGLVVVPEPKGAAPPREGVGGWRPRPPTRKHVRSFDDSVKAKRLNTGTRHLAI